MSTGSWVTMPQDKWTPLQEPLKPVKTKVSISRGGTVYIARILLAQIGNPPHLQPLRNGNPTLLGLRAASPTTGGLAVRINTDSSNFGGSKILKALGKSSPPNQTTLPHYIEDDVIVIDLSELPDRT